MNKRRFVTCLVLAMVFLTPVAKTSTAPNSQSTEFPTEEEIEHVHILMDIFHYAQILEGLGDVACAAWTYNYLAEEYNDTDARAARDRLVHTHGIIINDNSCK